MDNSQLKYLMDRYNIKRLLRLVAIIIPLALAGNIAYLVLTTESGFLKQIGGFDYRYFGLAIILALLPWFGQSMQILIWGRVFDVKISSSKAFKTVLASDIGAAITPTMLGGGYAKLGLLINYGFAPAKATLVTFLGSLADALFFVIALPLAVLWTRTWENPHVIKVWRDLISNWPVAIAVFLLFILFLIIIKNSNREIRKLFSKQQSRKGILGKIIGGVSKFKNDLVAAAGFVMQNGKKSFLACVLFAGIGWFGRYGAISALVAGLGYPVDPVLFFLLQWVVFTSMTLIPTPGAIGGAEVSFSLIYSGHIPGEAIPIITAAWRFVTFYTTVGLASIIFAISRLKIFTIGPEQIDSRVPDKPEIP
ncbi:MAG: lysylphosphatidylglycerol synthase transmembrane domain-containing protein [candidate division Zixibacteria bacterium]